MTRFLDGPAAGQTLGLRRAPLFLRAVRNEKGEWDALDQPDDSPHGSETIVAYKQVAFHGHVHVCRRPRGGGYFAMAEYRLVEPQPADSSMRTNKAWQEWCYARPEAEQYQRPSE